MVLPDPYMSVEDYLTFEERSSEKHEYIDGYMVALVGGTLNHSTICVNLVSLVRAALRGSPCRVYSSDVKVRLSEARYVYPDLTVSRDQHDEGTADILHSPRMVIEVLSPSTEGYDRGKKFDYYRECPSIQEYVLIDTQRLAVDVFRRTNVSDNLWTYHAFRKAEPVVIACLDIGFPMQDVYEDVQL